MTFHASTISEFIAHEGELRAEERLKPEIQSLKTQNALLAADNDSLAAEKESLAKRALAAEHAAQAAEQAAQIANHQVKLDSFKELYHDGLISKEAYEARSNPCWKALAMQKIKGL